MFSLRAFHLRREINMVANTHFLLIFRISRAILILDGKLKNRRSTTTAASLQQLCTSAAVRVIIHVQSVAVNYATCHYNTWQSMK